MEKKVMDNSSNHVITWNFIPGNSQPCFSSFNYTNYYMTIKTNKYDNCGEDSYLALATFKGRIIAHHRWILSC
ncbi:hypothetical protein JTB14_008729 [Gonioctena quinquepunctata]|nr:hypothetical protein JTB14_008729 [Gonioctena quinquepunctata]